MTEDQIIDVSGFDGPAYIIVRGGDYDIAIAQALYVADLIDVAELESRVEEALAR